MNSLLKMLCNPGQVISEFGCVEFEKARVELKDVKTKTACVELLGECYKQKGPAFVKKWLKAMTKDLQTAADAQFAKVGFDPALAEASVTKKAVAADEDGGADNAVDRTPLDKLLDKVFLKRFVMH